MAGDHGAAAGLQARQSGANVIMVAPARAGNLFPELYNLDIWRIHAICRSEYDPMPLLRLYFSASMGGPI
jgi:hypothetical protein